MGLLQKARKNAPLPAERPEPPRRGFLERAESHRAVDGIEQLCADRLGRLDPGYDSSFAALTILKAYYPSIAEIVFVKADGKFLAQESVGVSENACTEESVRFPILTGPLPAEGFYSFPAAELGISCLPGEATAYAFPVSTSSERVPPEGHSDDGYLVFVSNEAGFPASASIARIVKTFRHKFTKPDLHQVLRSAVPVEAAIKNLLGAMGEAHLLVFRLQDGGTSSSESFAEIARGRLGTLGTALSIGPNRVAVFLRAALDRELYAHQLLYSFRRSLSSTVGLTIERAEFVANQRDALTLLR